jgi:UDP-N-acetylglucosamine 2-epimerase (non-hydrolysing)
MTRVVCVAGARPNYMKIKPVMDALERRGAEVILVHTGQHYDRAMNDVFFEELGIRDPDHYLAVGSGTHAQQTSRTMEAFEPLVEQIHPDVVVVVGDVNGTLACALVAAKAGPYVAHVEAGLRSRDWTMPEEINRVATDRISDFLLAPSQDAVDNLRAEGYRDDQIHLVGNVMVDTLLNNIDKARQRDTLERYGVSAGNYALVTLHRPTNVDDPATLSRLLVMLGQLAERCPLVFPVHPRTRAQITDPPAGLLLAEPAGYLDFIALQASARLVLTDSGGVQEETTVLGVPCLTMRDNTERPITVTDGTNRVVGRDPDQVLQAALETLTAPPPPRRPALWDGHAGARIADVITAEQGPRRLRPTDRRP